MDFRSMFTFANATNSKNQSCFPTLSWTERMIGFIICALLGIIVMLIALMSFFSVATGSPAKFAIFYSFGNLLILAATGFLMGFGKQIQSMSNPQRRISSIIFVVAMIGTLASALFTDMKLLVVLFLAIQIPSFIWYVATYIPYGETCLKSCVGKCCQLFRA